MTVEELVEDEMKRLRPQLTRNEWFTLEKVLHGSLQRLGHLVYEEIRKGQS